MRLIAAVAHAIVVTAATAGAAQVAAQEPRETSAAALQPDACDNSDGAWSIAGFVLVVEPSPGARVTPGFVVRGCSRTFESNVTWRLVGRTGEVLGDGHATGGGVDGPGRFRFAVDYAVDDTQVAVLEVNEPVITQTEGYPPPRTVIPLVLRPAKAGSATTGAGEKLMLPIGSWTLETLEGDPVELEQPITLQLDENGHVSGFGGCNRYFTQWGEDAEGRVRFGVVGATRMFCPDTQQVETRFLGALSKVAGARRVGSHLEMTDATGKVLLRFAGTVR
jgi:heat shock protein HslJ